MPAANQSLGTAVFRVLVPMCLFRDVALVRNGSVDLVAGRLLAVISHSTTVILSGTEVFRAW